MIPWLGKCIKKQKDSVVCLKRRSAKTVAPLLLRGHAGMIAEKCMLYYTILTSYVWYVWLFYTGFRRPHPPLSRHVRPRLWVHYRGVPPLLTWRWRGKNCSNSTMVSKLYLCTNMQFFVDGEIVSEPKFVFKSLQYK